MNKTVNNIRQDLLNEPRGQTEFSDQCREQIPDILQSLINEPVELGQSPRGYGIKEEEPLEIVRQEVKAKPRKLKAKWNTESVEIVCLYNQDSIRNFAQLVLEKEYEEKYKRAMEGLI